VHSARLKDGTPVVLKIRRPGIAPVVEADLRILAKLAEIAEADNSALARFRPTALVRQLSQSLRRELDLDAECHSAERIAAVFERERDAAGNPVIVVPRVFWQWTNERMNVQERIEGIAGRDMAALDSAGLDRRVLAKRGAQAMFTMALQEGFFHADPHPGNVFYLPGNRLALIDFGMIGRLTAHRREQVVDLLLGLAHRDSESVARLLTDWAAGAPVDEDNLAQDVSAFTDRFYGLALEQIQFGRLLAHLTEIMRDHGIALPPDLALLFKAAVSLEGLGRMLDPGFHIVREATPFLQRNAAERLSPAALARRGAAELKSTLRAARGLPEGLRRMVAALRAGRAAVTINVPEIREFADRLDRSANRLTIGVVTAALIVGSSIVMTVGEHSGWFGPSLLGMAGFLASLIGGLWLLWSFKHSGKQH
jgi:ubiquinone biosynthesis protein